MIKLIASDLDDTLLNSDFKVSEKDRNTIKKLKEKGIYFTIATGRVTSAAAKYAEELEIDVPYISFNGAKIIDPKTSNNIFSRELIKSKINKIIQYAEKKGIHCNIYSDEKIYVKELNKWTEHYKSFARNITIEEVGSLQNYDFKSTPKILLLDENYKLQEAYEEIVQFIDKDINVFFSKPNFLEFTDQKASKGDALKYIAEMLDLKRNETAAIGDSFNDQSMIEYAGTSAVVGNGREELKKIANYVSSTNDEDGFSDFVFKYIL
ncbi:MAG: Cof-type HAD-IIB family hydrolase [Bacillota bacterium]|nr:Cof-type HAD-IIB family hydrolase [Bacillota bacterium]